MHKVTKICKDKLEYKYKNQYKYQYMYHYKYHYKYQYWLKIYRAFRFQVTDDASVSGVVTHTTSDALK